MTVQRQTILNSLFALFSVMPAWTFTGQKLVYWTEQIEQPAFFLRYVGDHHEKQRAYGLPQIVTMSVEAWVYVKSNPVGDPTDAFFVSILDAFDTQLATGMTFDGRQTLGMPDVIEHVWREGNATYSNGDLGDQIVLHIPLNIEVKGFIGSPS